MAMSKEQFDRKVAQDAERETKRREKVRQSSILPEGHPDRGKVTKLSDVFTRDSARQANQQSERNLAEIEANGHGINWTSRLPKNDPLRQAQMRKDFGIVDEQDKIAALEARIKELEQKNAN